MQQRAQTVGQILPRPQKLVVAREVERNAVGSVRQKAGEQLIGRHVHDRSHVRQAAHRVLEAALSDGAHARRNGHGPLQLARPEAMRADGNQALRKDQALRAAACVVALDDAHGVGYHHRGRRERQGPYADAHERPPFHLSRKRQHVARAGRHVTHGGARFPRGRELRGRLGSRRSGRKRADVGIVCNLVFAAHGHGAHRSLLGEAPRHRYRLRRPRYQHRALRVEVVPASFQLDGCRPRQTDAALAKRAVRGSLDRAAPDRVVPAARVNARKRRRAVHHRRGLATVRKRRRSHALHPIGQAHALAVRRGQEHELPSAVRKQVALARQIARVSGIHRILPARQPRRDSRQIAALLS